ncbi:adhesion G-protein coupled receptor G6 isoform X8 [Xenopus tropicalis]|uniref:Adhesion G-protein coupled receptor G6 n=1 Tax=Xenopus tropicalis TaxID=8364 RepID=A0A803J5P6_XENTR|nr:adhesion G-protein coupled receptor G6 isoform X8 [Xenopus tropicalis]
MIFQISGLWCSHWKWKMQYILLFFVVYVAFVQHSVLSCAVCRLTLTAPTGNVTSPCYPQLYPNNQDCKWIIQAPKGFIIQLTFVDFDVEEAQNCVYDYVSISNGETTTKYCGVTARGLTYNSTGNMMNISFVSDFSIQRKGFTATYKNVPVTLRNLKVTIPQNQSLGIVSVVSTVIVPTLNQFTVCFEAARFISSPAEWKAFTYWNSLTESLSFGKSPSGHFVYISGIQCHLNLTLTSLTVTGEFFTETLQEMCITWDSRSQIVGVKTGNNFQTSTCLESKDLHIPGNGSLILGCYDNKTSSLQGDIYNFRLWDTAFESVALSNLSCDQKGNIVNWENDFWSIPSWARKAGTDLSCGTSLSSTPSTATTTCKNLGGVCQAIAAQSATKQKQSTTATTATALSSTVPFTVSSTVPSNVSSTVASSVTSTISSTIVSTISSIASSTKTSTMSSSVPITVSSSIASSLLSTISSTILSTSSSTITSSKSSGAQSTVSSNVVSNESGTKSPTAPSSIASPPLSTVSSTILSASSSTKISSKSSSAQSTISSNIASNESGTKSPTAPSSIASPLLSNVSSTILSASSSTKISSKSSSAQSTVSSNLASNESRTNSPTAASSIASPLLSTVSSTILSASSSNKISSKSINVQSTISSNLASNESGTKSPTAPFSIASPLLSNVSSTILSASSSTKISSKSSSAQSTVSSNLASNESRIESTTAPSPIASPLLSTVLSTIFLTSSSTITSSKSSSAQSTVSSNFASNESATKSPTEPSSLVSPPLSTVSSTILSASSSTKISSKSSSAQSTIASNLASNESRTKSPTAPSSIASPLLSTVSSTILSTSSSTKTSSKSSSAQSTVFSNLASNESSTKSPSAPSSIASPLLSTVSSTILSSSSSTKTSSKSSSAQSTVLSNLASNESSIKSPSHESSTKSSNVSSTVSSTVLSTEPSPLKPTVPSILSSTVPSSSTLSESTEKSNVSSSIRSTVLSTLSTKSSTTTSTVPSVLLYTVPLIVSPVVPFTISPSMSSTVPSSETSSVSSTVTSSISSSVRSTEPSTLSSTVPSTIPSAVPIIVPSVMSSTVPSTMSSTVHSSETSTMPSTLLRAESSIISAVSSSLSSTIPYTTVTSTVSTLSFTDTTTSTTVTTNSASLATISTALPSPLNSITAPASSVTNAATSSPSTMITINMNDTNNINNSQPGGTFYRISITVVNNNLDNESEVQRTVSDWLKQSFQNWSYAVYLLNMSILPTNTGFERDVQNLIMKSMQQNHKRRARDINNKSFDVWALLVYNNSNNVVLETKTIYDKLLQNNDSIGDGLSLQAVSVYSVEPCMAEEYPFSYFWPITRPTVVQIIPCSKNIAFNASRKCSVGLLNYSSYWETPNTDNCTDLTGTEDAENVANELLNITGNGQVLTPEKVDQVVQKLKQIVNDANISASLGSTVVNVFSNLLSSPDDLLSKSSSDALKTIETLALKVQFTGPSVSILSPNLALGVSRMNSTSYTGSFFSVGSNTSSSEFEINMEKSPNSSLASVVLPSSLLSNLSESDFYTVSRAQFTFFNKSGLFQDSHIASGDQTLISYVVACSIGNITIKNLVDPVKITVKHKAQGTNREKTCVFWDTEKNNGKGGWNTYGCTVVQQESNVNETVCLCNHLTHFGILMDLQRTSQHIDQQNSRILTFITYIGCGISAICTAATLLTYIAFEKIRRDYPSKILMNLSTALLFLNLFFLLDGWIASFGINELCITVAVLLHFFLLATFTWMGLEAVHMYIALVKVFNTYIRRYMLKFCIIGWGLPAIIVSVVLASTHSNIAYGSSSYGQDSRGNGGDEFCWIKSDTVFYVTCAAYFAIMFLMNVAMFIVVMVQICGRNGKRTNRSIREEVLRNLRSVVSLTFLLGMTWGFAFFAWGPVNLAFMYLFTIFNSLQGLFIFVFHCALKENVQKQWRRHLCCGKLRLTDNSDWSKTATNNTKKVSSDNLGKSLSSSSIGSNSTYLTSKSKSSTKPFFKRNSSTGYIFGDRPSVKFTPVDGEQTSILPVHHVIDKVKGYYNSHSDNFYKNIIMSDSYSKSTKF